MPGCGFTIDGDILDEIRADDDIARNIQTFPDLYVRVRIDNIQYLKNSEPDTYRSRLDKFLESCREGRMFGKWDDGGRQEHGHPFILS